MASVSPASDPIFFLYHSFIDLLLERWIRNAMSHGVFAKDNSLPVSHTFQWEAITIM
jgi:hypothetical protein